MQPQILLSAPLTHTHPAKRVWVAYALWLTCGWFGLHRFYSGTPLTAICQILLGVVAAVLYICDIHYSDIPVGVYTALSLLGLWLVVDAFLIPGLVSAANMKRTLERFEPYNDHGLPYTYREGCYRQTPQAQCREPNMAMYQTV
ncbi:hypothetical protein KIPB_008551 [Kipferlia bialata]|uniref:TM2 domain-containing protein n=1 Tax=Kipferlia bialata TaxID=797122 RepID=A0A9K3D065_9EUKA|nr:hypothetical protein KIPB_008551 [Kipferlia bialata]|eukprot:g8551.t1